MNKAKIRKIEYYYVGLKQIRIDKGYTIRGLCKKLRIDPSNYSKMERGKLPIDEDLYKKIILTM
jgi:transcriptional regulator with XRE-family HTH domain